MKPIIGAIDRGNIESGVGERQRNGPADVLSGARHRRHRSRHCTVSSLIL
jgi:hypothetical protein